MNEKEIIRLAQELAKNPYNLRYAVERSDVGYVKLLIEAGADANALGGNIFIEAVKRYVDRYSNSERTEEIFKLLLKAGADVNTQDGEPLIMTIKYGACKQLQELIEAGADVNIRNGEPLLCAVIAARMRFKGLERIRILVEAGADITAQSGNLLKVARKSQDDEVLDFLINELNRKERK